MKNIIVTGDIWIIDEESKGNIHLSLASNAIEYYITDVNSNKIDQCVIGDSRFPSKKEVQNLIKEKVYEIFNN